MYCWNSPETATDNCLLSLKLVLLYLSLYDAEYTIMNLFLLAYKTPPVTPIMNIYGLGCLKGQKLASQQVRAQLDSTSILKLI